MISLPLAKPSLRGQIKSLNDPRERNLRRLIHRSDEVCVIGFKATPATLAGEPG
jgi:hypothetical protein